MAPELLFIEARLFNEELVRPQLSLFSLGKPLGLGRLTLLQLRNLVLLHLKDLLLLLKQVRDVEVDLVDEFSLLHLFLEQAVDDLGLLLAFFLLHAQQKQ